MGASLNRDAWVIPQAVRCKDPRQRLFCSISNVSEHVSRISNKEQQACPHSPTSASSHPLTNNPPLTLPSLNTPFSNEPPLPLSTHSPASALSHSLIPHQQPPHPNTRTLPLSNSTPNILIPPRPPCPTPSATTAAPAHCAPPTPRETARMPAETRAARSFSKVSPGRHRRGG